MDRIERTIQLTRPAFHASLGVDKVSEFAFHLESTVRANVHADTASGAKRWVILECVGLISIEHISLPISEQNNGNVKQKAGAEHPGHRRDISEHFAGVRRCGK